MHSTSPPVSPLMSTAEVAAWLCTSEDSIRRWVRAGSFVTPVRLGQKHSRMAFKRQEVAAWCRGDGVEIAATARQVALAEKNAVAALVAAGFSENDSRAIIANRNKGNQS